MIERFFLICESSFHASYLVTKWMEAFEQVKEFRGIAARAEWFLSGTSKARESFHRRHAGERQLSLTAHAELQRLYSDMSDTERSMIQLFGVPSHSATFHPTTIFLGPDLNSDANHQWLAEVCREGPTYFFIFLDQMLAPWWIDLTGARIINAHSAVLPYARGMFAMERVAMSEDLDAFSQVLGATVHYIDTGVDTGPVIRAARLVDCWLDSIWEEKGYVFTVAFDLLIEVARDMLARPHLIPVGTPPETRLRGPAFKRSDFTSESRLRAERGYLTIMKEAARRRSSA